MAQIKNKQQIKTRTSVLRFISCEVNMEKFYGRPQKSTGATQAAYWHSVSFIRTGAETVDPNLLSGFGTSSADDERLADGPLSC